MDTITRHRWSTNLHWRRSIRLKTLLRCCLLIRSRTIKRLRFCISRTLYCIRSNSSNSNSLLQNSSASWRSRASTLKLDSVRETQTRRTTNRIRSSIPPQANLVVIIVAKIRTTSWHVLTALCQLWGKQLGTHRPINLHKGKPTRLINVLTLQKSLFLPNLFARPASRALFFKTAESATRVC